MANSSTDSIADLILRIQSTDETVSTPAWQNAGPAGAKAVKPLVGLMGASDPELGRRARRALEGVVRHTSHPKLNRERRDVEIALIEVLPAASVPVRRTILWLLSEVGSNRSVAPIAAQLSNPELREDARCALTRLPTSKAVRAIRSAFDAAPEDFKYALAESLRVRGQKVKGYASQKLVPTRQTEVQPARPGTS